MPTNPDNLPDINVKEYMGFAPTSVWHITKSKSWTEAIGDSGEAAPKRKDTNKFLPGLKYSSFNPNVAEAIIKYWSNEGDLIVDPFAGRSTRAFVSLSLGRKYEGYDVSPYAIKHLKSNNLIRENGVIHQADGCQLQFSLNDSADLIFTCPPYFDLEKYESCDSQLTDIKKYKNFLKEIKKAFHSCFRVLKNGKYCIWVVGDFRKNNSIVPFHCDCIQLAIEEGFKLHDVVIEEVNSPFVWCRIRENFRLKFTAKGHQYILVFKKW